MSDEYNEFEKFVENEMLAEGEQIEKEVEADPEVKDIEAGEDLKKKLYDRIAAYEDEKIINMLSEEAREQLMLGRKFMKEQQAEKAAKEESDREAEKATDDIRRKKRSRRVRVSLGSAATVAVLTLVIGINSVGKPNRIIEMIKHVVGGSEMTRVSSYSDNDDDIKKSDKSKEELGYQQVSDELGIEPVRILIKPESMIFSKIEVDKILETANLCFLNDDRRITYLISGTYIDDSFVYGTDDIKLDEYEYELKKSTAHIKVYKMPNQKIKKYSALFEYKDIYYCISGILEKSDLELILNNLYFF